MFETVADQCAFMNRYNISAEAFREAQLSWDVLREIADHYLNHENILREELKKYVDVIEKCPEVHAVSHRLKDVEHLIEKIIRKNSKYVANGKSISKENYMNCITDLIGIRILLLFKEDWKSVHHLLVESFGSQFVEPPFVYIRKGDSRDIYENLIEIKDERSYRSAHYVIRTESGACIEVQVRTMFEDAWGEIDHKLRYPYNVKNQMINAYMDLLNRLTGMADEMGTFIYDYLKAFEDSGLTGIKTENETYNTILERLKDCQDIELKNDLESIIKRAEKYQKYQDFSELIDEFIRRKREN